MEVKIVDPLSDAALIIEGLAPELTEGALNELISRTISRCPPTFLAAHEAGRIIGLVAFRQHRFSIRGSPELKAFQAAGVLTAPSSRGRGVFPAIVRAAEEVLAADGGAFIFGFPNVNAYPIWKDKLNYSSVRLASWRAPAHFGLERMFVSGARFNDRELIVQDNDDLINSKRKFYKHHFVRLEEEGSLIWGVVRNIHKAGQVIRVLDIGGIECGDAFDLKGLLRKAIGEASRPHLIRMQTTATNPILSALRCTKISKLAHEVLIFKWLDGSLSPDRRMSVFSGAAEWF